MAGSFETLHKVKKIGQTIVERLLTLEYLSDDTDGSVPNAEIENLSNYYLSKILTTPDATAIPAAYRVRIEDEATGRLIFLGSLRSTSLAEAEDGYLTGGSYPSLQDTILLKLVGADGTTAIDLGNEKITTVALLLVRKVG